MKKSIFAIAWMDWASCGCLGGLSWNSEFENMKLSCTNLDPNKGVSLAVQNSVCTEQKVLLLLLGFNAI